jgi:hypothetical protein
MRFIKSCNSVDWMQRGRETEGRDRQTERRERERDKKKTRSGYEYLMTG